MHALVLRRKMAATQSYVRTLAVTCLISSVQMAIFNPQFEADLRELVNITMDCRNIPALTLAVFKDNETWTSGFGFADLDQERTATNNTLFNIGSITKSFTMVLLGSLLTEYKDKGWTWRTKFRDIMGPDYGFSDQYRTDELILRDMLTHRTGVATLQDFSIFAGIPLNISRKQYSKLMKLFPQSLPFRDDFQYNNHMYMLLGHVAEVIGGASWESLMTSKLFQPLGMNNTKILLHSEDVYTDQSAKPYIYKDGAFVNATKAIFNIHPQEPAGAILSTADDMSKWLQFMLGDGQTPNGTRLIDKDLFFEARKGVLPSTMDRMELTRPDFPVSANSPNYGYALFAGHYRGYPLVWHDGGMFSYISLMWFLPKQNLGLFVSVNGHGSHFSSSSLATIFFNIIDELMNESHWINKTTACTFPEPWRNDSSPARKKEEYVDIIQPKDYVGQFGNRYMIGITITTDPDDNVTLLFAANRIKGRIYGTNDKDRLVVEFTEPWEIRDLYSDENNVSIGVNMTFHRKEDVITGFDFHLGTKVPMERGVSIGDDVTSSASGLLNEKKERLAPIVSIICLVLTLRLPQ